MKKRTVIYGLFDPDTPLIRYVGKTSLSPRVRWNAHLTRARTGRCRTPSGLWIRSLLDEGRQPLMVLLDSVEGDGGQAERQWITLFENLLNVRAGANGNYQVESFPTEHQDKLGVWSDARIGELLGKGREWVKYHRNKQGIGPAYDKTRKTKPPIKKYSFELSDEIIARLGKEPDDVIAAELGIAKPTLRQRRDKLGIPPYNGPLRIRKGSSKLKNSYVTPEIRVLVRRDLHNGGIPLKHGEQGQIAKKYGLTVSTMSKIKRGKLK